MKTNPARTDDGRLRCKCMRCGYDWITKTGKEPKCCPMCKQYRWKEPRATGE